MKITMTPPIRNAFDRARTCEIYKTRLLELFNNNEAEIKLADEYCRKYMPPIHHFKTWCAIARIEALIDYLPSERAMVDFIHEYEVK
jgi:hypothetical protein